MAQWIKGLPVTPASPMGAGSCPCSPTPNPANGLGKTEGGLSVWVPATMWETHMKLLAPGFELAQPAPLTAILELN